MRAALAVIVLLGGIAARLPAAQAPAPPVSPVPDARPRSPYFSGFVSERNADSITVSRKTGNGKTTIQKIFLIDPQTRIEGKLKANSRVTVRYETVGTAQRAIHIIVR